jgi:amino acid adenylation domain-containing protein
LPVLDLSSVPVSQQAAEVEELLQKRARQPFDLERGPLFRAQLIRLGPEQHVLDLNMHHIVSDGWSLHILVRELAAFYQAGLKKEASPVPALPIQYADFALWQRQWLQGEKLEQQLSYWRRQLAHLPVLELPLDFPRPALRSMSGSRITRRLRGELVKGARQLGRKHDATLFITLLAVFEVLLLRYSGADDLAVGTPVANRDREEIEGLIGFFVNTLVMRADLGGDPAFTVLLGRLRETALGAYAHPDLPFEMLVEELKPDRQLSRTPLFQVMFALQSEPLPELNIVDLRFTPLKVETGTVKFDLLMTVEEVNAEELAVHMDYSTELFAAGTIERMLGHFQNLLQSAVDSPETHLSGMNILGEEERQQIVRGWNATELDSGAQESASAMFELPTMFEEQVERTPSTTAVEYEQERLSYRELNQRANQWARYLRKLGVGPEVRVALLLERGLDMVAALMGVLKSGAGYVPLNPEYPVERLAFILRETEASFVITERSLLGLLPESQALALCLEEKLPDIRQESTENLALSIDAGNLAYMIYTSGSTGESKGVCIEHGQLANYMRAISKRIDLGRRVATAQPISFDACLTALIGPLLSGGTIHVLSTVRAQSPVDMAQYLEEKDIEILKIAPSHLMTLQASSTVSLMPKQTLVLGGEASRWSWVQDLCKAAPGCSIVNQYGPTETTIGVSTFTVGDLAAGLEYSVTPLGKPLAGVRIYALDEQMQPVPVGVPGELYIGGDSVGRGYLNRPELTAQKFLPDPFIQKAGSRMYQTGDRGRYLTDGNLEFLGRTDQQVKVRGFRVELE